MKITYEWDTDNEWAQQEAIDALNAGKMKSAAYEFDSFLRNIIKYNNTLPEQVIAVYELLREKHREQWVSKGVDFNE